jgi:hypothetical protein
MTNWSETLSSDLPLVPRTWRSHWDTAVRLSPGIDLVETFASLAGSLAAIATRWQCSLSLAIEPDGDACDTGHFVDVEAELAMVWADMTPWPSRFGGAVPHLLDVEMELAGWILVTEGADPDPVNCVCEMTEFMTDEQLQARQLPARRLVAAGDHDDLISWATRLVHATRRVIQPRDDRWYLVGEARASMGGALSTHPTNRSGEFHDIWSLDVAALLQPGACQRAVWPVDSEAAALACERGLHEYHEPPCLSPATRL